MTPRAITGLGVLSALGIGREAFYASLRDGKSPRREAPSTVLDPATYPAAAVAEVPDFDATRFLGDKGLRSLDRQTKLLVVAARLAVHDSGLKKDGAFVALGPERVGLCASNAYGSLEAVVELDRVAVLEDARYINPAKFPNTVANSASGYVSIWEDLRALNVAVSDGNCGALDTVTCADLYLDTGRADAILVGGGEALSEALYVAFQRLGSLAAETLLGEGAALLVLETLESARGRGARVDALVLGTGTSFGAPPRAGSLLQASAEAMERAVAWALEDAGVAASDVDLVVSGVSHAGGLRRRRATGSRAGARAGGRGRGAEDGARRDVRRERGDGDGRRDRLDDGVPVSSLLRGAAPARVTTTVATTLGYYGNATAVVLRNPHGHARA